MEEWRTITAPGQLSSWSPEMAERTAAPSGWALRTIGTFDESFSREVPFAVALYEVYQEALPRAKFTVTADAAWAQAGANTALSPGVMPYVSLGAGYRPNVSLEGIGLRPGNAPGTNFPTIDNNPGFPFAERVYDVGYDPDLSYAAVLGGLINQGGPTFNSSGYFRAFGPWERARGAIFYPSVFDTMCPGDGSGCVQASVRTRGSTNIFDHFLAFIGGARSSYWDPPGLKTDDQALELSGPAWMVDTTVLSNATENVAVVMHPLGDGTGEWTQTVAMDEP